MFFLGVLLKARMFTNRKIIRIRKGAHQDGEIISLDLSGLKDVRLLKEACKVLEIRDFR